MEAGESMTCEGSVRWRWGESAHKGQVATSYSGLMDSFILIVSRCFIKLVVHFIHLIVLV
jgi:hypothetical protein